MKKNKKSEIAFADMYTPEGEALLACPEATPWQRYPRPHLKRSSFLCLNGEWEFCATAGEPSYSEKILVPFPPQSLLSGVHRSISDGETLCYRKSFGFQWETRKGLRDGGDGREFSQDGADSREGLRDDSDGRESSLIGADSGESLRDGGDCREIFQDGADAQRDRAILHIDAADNSTRVRLNGHPVGEHSGGYDRISLDVTDFISEENVLEIFVTDHHESRVMPYGKQCENRGGMWYTPVSGVWQTVWLEQVPRIYITEIGCSSDLTAAEITVKTNLPSADGRVILHLPAGDEQYPLRDGKALISPHAPRLWSPEDPFLYRFTAEVGDDRVESYFALRTVTVEAKGDRKHLCLNGKPYFFHGLLDQGYYSDGIFLPASPEGYERDILAARELGFNTLRKHIKLEPDVFYYECDRLGMIVFQDMVNNGDYSFLRDTALPTVGFKRKNDKRLHRHAETRAQFIKCMEQAVRRLSFHPSVCYWTIFNEGWGQFDHAAAYERLRELDRSRPIDSVSGWFSDPRRTVSDVESPHVYFKKVKISRGDRPVVLSEFGGFSYKVEGHSFNPVQNYGYGSCASSEELEKALESLYLEQIIPAIRRGLCGAVYTQLTDVEDETNGLLTYDRRITKVDAARMQSLARALILEFERALQ